MILTRKCQVERRRDETVHLDVNPPQVRDRIDRFLGGPAVTGPSIRRQAIGDLPQHAGSSNSGSLANLLASRIGRPRECHVE